MTDERRSGGGFGAALVLLVAVGAIAKFIWWIAAGLAGGRRDRFAGVAAIPRR